MATTRELANILVSAHKGWNLDGAHGVLWPLWQAECILCTARIAAHRLFDTKGQPPTFATTAGSQGPYEPHADLRIIDKILVAVGTRSSLSTIGIDYGYRANTRLAIQRETVSGVQYAIYPYCTTVAGDDTNPASVTFTVDPGDTTDVYRAWGYIKPPELTSVSVPLVIKPPWDQIYLLPAASKIIEGVEHGNIIETRAHIMKLIVPAYARDAGREGYSGYDDGEPVARGF